MTSQGGPGSRTLEEEDMETTREGYRQQVEGQLKQWSTRLEALQAKAEGSGVEAKRELLAELAKLRKLEAAGRRHLVNVEAASAGAWDEVKVGLADKWTRVNGAVDVIWAGIR
jgi:antirestriction protein ArdC